MTPRHPHSTKPIRIGLDFDGVVAANPLRIVRGPITFIKRHIFKKKKTEFYIPTSPLMKFAFWLPHQWSVFPGYGVGILKQLVHEGNVEACIVSGRYGYLDAQIPIWLKRRGLDKTFTAVYANEKNEQPHIFKERMLKKLQLDYFIEDNLDIVLYLAPRVKTKILWIYNSFDFAFPYDAKYASVFQALKTLMAHR
ncbi:MAG: hypothetical protein WAV51_05220 [Microgenomates group bacterium]